MGNKWPALGTMAAVTRLSDLTGDNRIGDCSPQIGRVGSARRPSSAAIAGVWAKLWASHTTL